MIIGTLVCCLLWGSAFPCIKLGYSWSNIPADSPASQILYAGIRFTFAGIFAVLGGSLIERRFLHPHKESVPRIMVLSLFQTMLQYFFFYIGLAHTSGVKASVIEATNVFVAVIIAGLIFRMEDVGVKKILGCIVGFAGVIMINLKGFDAESFRNIFTGFALNGEGFLFISTFAYAFSSVLLKKFSDRDDPVMLSGYQFIFGGLVMTAAGAAFGGRVEFTSPKSVLILVYLAFLSAAAYSLWGTLLKYNPVSKVAVFGFMNPVFGFLLSAWFLNEADSIGIMAVISLILVCIGIFIVNSTGSVEKTDHS